MTARPWMPLYIGDYLADTSHLTATEHGAYLLLLMHHWQHGSLPADDELLTRIARVHPPHWPRIKRVLGSFFETQEDGSWIQKRLLLELNKTVVISQKRAAAALQKHANVRANAERLQTHARGLLQPHSPLQEGSLRSPSADPDPLVTFPSIAPSQAPGAAQSSQLELVSEEPLEIPAVLDRRPYPEAFEALWDEYRPIGNRNATKADAHRAWAKLSATDKANCFEGLALYASWFRDDNRKRAQTKRSPGEVKHLATFINKRGWEPFLEQEAQRAAG